MTSLFIDFVRCPINLARTLAEAAGFVTSFHLPSADKATLDRWVRARRTRQGVLLRSRIILLLGHGLSGRAVAEKLKVSRHTVDLWRARYRDGGCVALTREKPGRGRKRASQTDVRVTEAPSGPVISVTGTNG